MKLYLSSFSVPNQQVYLDLFAGKEHPKVALVTNAWGTYPVEKSKPYIDALKEQFQQMGITLKSLDLLDYVGKQDELYAKLSTYDGMWVTGGNSYYLNWAIHQSGLQYIIHDLCEQGFVYGGESAGAIVAGPTLKHFQELDDPSEAPETVLDGMKLTNIVIVPHKDNLKYGEKLEQARLQLKSDGYKTQALADAQVMVSDANSVTILPAQVADVVIVKDNAVLLVQQRKESAHGLWSYPGGLVEPGETLEEAVIREVQEELGVELKNPAFFKTYSITTSRGILDINTFTGHIDSDIKLKDDELMDYAWFTLAELDARQDELRVVPEQAKDVLTKENQR